MSIGIDRLERLQSGVFSREDMIESLLYIRRLWAVFIEDLAHPENGLPDKLRADIISIGLWIVREADRLREERSNNVVQLIEINRLIGIRFDEATDANILRGERIYINGAVLRVDRKVAIELVNDVMFLLEGQVMQAADATTALRQLYFIVQLMLMNPTDAQDADAMYGRHHAALRAVCENQQMLEGLAAIDDLVGANRYYEAPSGSRAVPG